MERKEFALKLEYFESLSETKQSKSVLRKVKGIAIKDKKAPVAPSEDSADLYGTINFYGAIKKRRADTDSFHKRWMVLRGLQLYLYRKVEDQQ